MIFELLFLAGAGALAVGAFLPDPPPEAEPEADTDDSPEEVVDRRSWRYSSTCTDPNCTQCVQYRIANGLPCNCTQCIAERDAERLTVRTALEAEAIRVENARATELRRLQDLRRRAMDEETARLRADRAATVQEVARLRTQVEVERRR